MWSWSKTWNHCTFWQHLSVYFFWTKDLMSGTTVRHHKTSEKVSHTASGWITAELLASLPEGLKMRDELSHSSQTQAGTMCLPDLRACLISERERAKEPPGIREKQTMQKRIKKNEKKKRGGGLQKWCFRTVLNWWQISADGMVYVTGRGSNGHRNTSNKKYCYKAGYRFPLASLARRAEGSTQPLCSKGDCIMVHPQLIQNI